MSKFMKVANGIILIALIFTLCIATIIRNKGRISFHEDRELASFPDINADSVLGGGFLHDIQKFVADHFAGRSKFLSANATIQKSNCERIVNGVYIADEMLLNTQSGIETDRINDAAEKINRFAEMYGNSVFVLAVPSSNGIYDNLLPQYLTANSQKTQIENFYDALSSNIKKIYAYNTLKMYQDNYIYYRNDSRWTSYGAYCVYSNAIIKLGFSPIPYDRFIVEHITDRFRGDLYNNSQYTGIKPDNIDINICIGGGKIVSMKSYNSLNEETDIVMYDKSYLHSNDMYKLFLGGVTEPIIIKTDVNNERKILVIKDEYANCFIPFLINHYSEIAVLDNSCDYDILNPGDYSEVLFLSGIENI